MKIVNVANFLKIMIYKMLKNIPLVGICHMAKEGIFLKEKKDLHICLCDHHQEQKANRGEKK